MSKFFVQLLLSVVVGVSAALSFNSNLKSELHGTFQKATASLHEATTTVLENANDLKMKLSAAISVKATSQASTGNSEKVELWANSNVKVKGNSGDSVINNLLPNFSANTSSATQIKTETDTPDLDVSLKDKTTSTLNLDLGSGK